MTRTPDQVMEALKAKRKELFPVRRAVFILVTRSRSYGAGVEMGLISLAIAVFVFLAYMAIVVNWILDGLFEELEWIQAENANFRGYVNNVIERAGEWMSNRAP